MSRLVIALSVVLLAACGGETNNSVKVGNNANNTDPNSMTSGNNGMTSGTNGSTNGSTNNGGTNNGSTNNGSTNNNTVPANVTYHEHVRPIVKANCTQCHYNGGIGPFPLTTYEEVSALSGLILGAVNDGVMPPWPPAPDCGPKLKYERTLTDVEKQTLQAWVDAGKPEGDPADYVPPADQQVDLGTPDFVADIGVDYTPDPPGGGIDDYHCFIVEHDFTEDKFMNAFQVRPGDISTVHHVLFWQIDNGSLQSARNKESSPGAGYTCFGSNGVGGETGLIGGWVPGATPLQFDEGQGMRIPSDSFIVVQIHYNTVNGASPDRTEIDMWFTDGPASTPLGMYPLPDTDLFVPAGEANGKAGRGVTLPIGVPIYGVVPHMHTLGTRIRVEAGNQCLIDIPDWDFNWQGFYLFEEPFQTSAGARLELECWYDNSAANQPDGRTPQDVRWGEGTYDEMCLNYFITREFRF